MFVFRNLSKSWFQARHGSKWLATGSCFVKVKANLSQLFSYIPSANTLTIKPLRINRAPDLWIISSLRLSSLLEHASNPQLDSSYTSQVDIFVHWEHIPVMEEMTSPSSDFLRQEHKNNGSTHQKHRACYLLEKKAPAGAHPGAPSLESPCFLC